METFTLCVQVAPSSEVGFRALRTDFGDGYTQEAGDGINTRHEKWSVAVKGRISGVVGEAMAFLDRHEGFRAFEWQSPTSGLKTFKCREGYSLQHVVFDIYTLSATFEEVFA